MMRSSFELGAVFQLESNETPVRVIAFDDDVVMYDAWWQHIESWGMAKLIGTFSYYRMHRAFFEKRSRYLRTDTYTEEEHKVHRPDLPFAFAQHNTLGWHTQKPNCETDLERQLVDARTHEQASAENTRLAAPAIYLAPFGPKGPSKPGKLITAQDGESLTEVEVLWHAWNLQAPYLREHQITQGIGIHRSGIRRRKPSYYIWGASSKLDAPPA